MTSLSTAGSAMPLESPTAELVCVVSAVVDNPAVPATSPTPPSPPVPPPAPAPPPPVVDGGRCPSSQRSSKFARGRDGRDPFLEELMVGILKRDHDLGIVPVRIDFTLECLRGAEGKRRRDDAIDLAWTNGIVDERMLDDVSQAVIEQVARSERVGRSRQ